MLKEHMKPFLKEEISDADSEIHTSLFGGGEKGSERNPQIKKRSDTTVSTGSGQNMGPLSRLYRISELFGFSRDYLRTLMAKESACNGLAKKSVAVCREIYQKKPDSNSAIVLRDVGSSLMIQALNQAHLVRSVSTNSSLMKRLVQLPSQVQQLTQWALSICEPKDMPDCLDFFHDVSLSTAIVSQSDLGEFDSLWSQSSSLGSSASMEPIGMKERFGSELFAQMYHEEAMVLDSKAALEMTIGFAAHRELVRQTKRDVSDKETMFRTISELSGVLVDVTNTVMHFLKDNESLQNCLVIMLQAALEYGVMETETDTENVEKQLSRLLGQMVSKVLRSRYIDHAFAVGCLSSLSASLAYDMLRTALPSIHQDYDRLQRLAKIGIDCGLLWCQHAVVAEMRNLETNSKWWHQFTLLDIPFDYKLFVEGKEKDSRYQKSLVPVLLEKTSMDIYTVLDFCREYRVDEDYALSLYVEMLLLTPQLDSTGTAFSLDYQNQVAGVARDIRADRLLDLLEQHCLTNVSSYDYERIKFICEQILVLKSDHHQARRMLILIDMLFGYKRTSNNDSVDMTMDLHRNRNGKPYTEVAKVINRLASTRLPVRELMQDPWAILSVELTVDTSKKLLPMCSPLQLETDQFYVQVIKNIVSQHQKQFKDDSTKPMPPFSTMKTHLFDIRSRQVAVETVEWLVSIYPLTDEKLSLLQAAVTLCSKWVEVLTLAHNSAASASSATANNGSGNVSLLPRASELLDRFKKMEKRLSTEYQLQSYGLDSFIEFVEKPAELICQLYFRIIPVIFEHSNRLSQTGRYASGNGSALSSFLASLVSVAPNTNSNRSMNREEVQDVNVPTNLNQLLTESGLHKLINEIAVRHGENINEIRQYLIQRWLTAGDDPSSSNDGSATPTGMGGAMLSSQMSAKAANSKSEDDIDANDWILEDEPGELSRRKELKDHENRVLSLAQAGDVLQNCVFLLSFAFNQKSSKITYLSRARAISVLFRLASVETIKGVYKHDIADLRVYWQHCFYMSELDHLRIPQTVQKLITCNKESFIRSIWKNHQHEPRAIQLMCMLAVDFKVTDTRLWTGLLVLLLQFQRHAFLYRTLHALCSDVELAHTVFGNGDTSDAVRVWEECLMAPISVARDRMRNHNLLTPASLNLLNKIPSLLLKCPILGSLNVKSMASALLSLGPQTHSLACQVALLIPDASQRANMLHSLVESKVFIPLLDLLNPPIESNVSSPTEALISMGSRSSAEPIRAALFTAIDKSGAYHVIVPTRHFQAFVQYLVANKSIRGLLHASLKLGKIQEAHQLVLLFCQVHNITLHLENFDSLGYLEAYAFSQSDQEMLRLLQGSHEPHAGSSTVASEPNSAVIQDVNAIWKTSDLSASLGLTAAPLPTSTVSNDDFFALSSPRPLKSTPPKMNAGDDFDLLG
eukprot:GILJ01015436.1.p1 GENE.GILJ01015436.1~~GILJ01015436.1.p1  ORF type:complete len:1444 (-),score=284.33 GILJ01015436.1:57-4322(-)